MSAKNKEWRHPVKQWVILDMFSAFRDDHIWTYEQAVLSVMIDMDRKRKGTIRGYASLWNWGKTKVGDLLPQIKDDAKAELKPFAKKEEKEAKNTKNERTRSGQCADNERTTSGQRADKKRTTSGQRADKKRTTSGQRADKTEAQSRIEYDLNADFENGGGQEADNARTTRGQEADNARTTRGQEADNARTHTNHTSIPHKSPPQELGENEIKKQPSESNVQNLVSDPHPNLQLLLNHNPNIQITFAMIEVLKSLKFGAVKDAIAEWQQNGWNMSNVLGIIDKAKKIQKLCYGDPPSKAPAHKPYKTPNPAKPPKPQQPNPLAQMAAAMVEGKTQTGWKNPYEGKSVEERVQIAKDRNNDAEFEKWGMVGLQRKEMMQMVELMDNTPVTQKRVRGMRRAI